MTLSVTDALVTRLVSDATISSIVGDRIRPVQAAQDDVTPIILFQRASGSRYQTLAGYIDSEDVTFDTSSYATTDAVARQLVEAIRQRLNLKGDDVPWRVNPDDPTDTRCYCVTENDVSDGQESPQYAEELALYRGDLTFTITY